MNWLRQILDWQKENKDALKFIENLKVEFFGEEIFCFTPMGNVIELPKGATVLDFAYAVHSQIGDHAQGAKVNEKFVPLRHELEQGDVVQIITAKNVKPGRSWIKIAKTSRALNKIKRSLTSERNIPFKRIIKKKSVSEKIEKNLIVIKGVHNPNYKIAKCCNPLPGDDIVGYEIKNEVIKIHKSNCDKTHEMDKGPLKKRAASWRKDLNKVISLMIQSDDRVGFGADLLNTISATGTNINKANMKLKKDNTVDAYIDVEVENLEHLKDLISRINRINGVMKVIVEGEEV